MQWVHIYRGLNPLVRAIALIIKAGELEYPGRGLLKAELGEVYHDMHTRDSYK